MVTTLDSPCSEIMASSVAQLNGESDVERMDTDSKVVCRDSLSYPAATSRQSCNSGRPLWVSTEYLARTST